jgi:arylsulfatase
VLEAQGWSTGAFVSNPLLDRNRRFSQGFDKWDQRLNRDERNRPGWGDRDARGTTEAALSWAQGSAQPPWFLWVHYQDPHGPYDSPGAAPARDAPGGPKLPLLEDNSGRGGIPLYQQIPGVRSAAVYEHRYLEEIRYLDREVKRLIEGLDGRFDPPVVVLTADHGEAFGEDGYWFAHGHSVGLDQVRVPLLVRPRFPTSGSVERQAVSLLDVAPTLLAAAGIEAPREFEGRALPLAGDAAEREARSVFVEHDHQVALIEGARYYARERAPRAPTERRNAYSPVLIARTARLTDDGRLPHYETLGDGGAELEQHLARFLAQSPPATASAPARELSAADRELLNRLGYTD